MTIELSIPPASSDVPIEYRSLPTKPGVFLFQDEDGHTLALAMTANLRRFIRSRLEPSPSETTPSRRINYRDLSRTVHATTVGSAFEADWVYLQLARRHLPTTYAMMLDKWPCWFVHVDPDAKHPRWTKTSHPSLSSKNGNGCLFGPLADKHAAAKYIETVEDAFDLCRYHHILLDSPHASACAYKEMGRCDAPCDGSITMEAYRALVRETAEFASTPIERWRHDIESKMKEAGENLDYERATSLKNLLDRTTPVTKRDFAHVREIEAFRFLGVFPSEHPDRARLFLVMGGRIEPFIDVPIEVAPNDLDSIIDALKARADSLATDLRDASLENLGLVVRHLFKPKRDKKKGELIHLEEALDRIRLAKALHGLKSKNSESNPEESLEDQLIESLS
ncbi:MAG: hypothetical protein O7G85_05445 [Planctomycetota bacterium]|nr:hypothetical protein [Planctomycetota bacterium]